MVRVTLGLGVGVGVGVEAGVGVGSGSVLVLGLGFDKDCGVLHRAELLRAQEVTRLGRPGQRAHHDVALLEERALVRRLDLALVRSEHEVDIAALVGLAWLVLGVG